MKENGRNGGERTFRRGRRGLKRSARNALALALGWMLMNSASAGADTVTVNSWNGLKGALLSSPDRTEIVLADDITASGETSSERVAVVSGDNLTISGGDGARTLCAAAASADEAFITLSLDASHIALKNLTVANAVRQSESIAYGGALYRSGDLSIDVWGSVGFSGSRLTVTGDDQNAFGGAISVQNGAVQISGDASLAFLGNRADTLGNVPSTSGAYARAYGGAVYAKQNIDIDAASLEIRGNAAKSLWSIAYGGAFYSEKGSVRMTTSRDVVIAANRADASGPSNRGTASGGAVYAKGDVVIRAARLEAADNAARSERSDALGGALCAGNSVDINASEDVTFSGNRADGLKSAQGGAVYAYQNIVIAAKDLNVVGNAAKSTAGGANSGAFRAKNVSINASGRVTISANSADAYGGAVGLGAKTQSTIKAGSLNVTGNVAKSRTSQAESGAFQGFNSAVTILVSEDASISDNRAEAQGDAWGGAVNGNTLTIAARSLDVRGNRAVSSAGNAWGGAFNTVLLNIDASQDAAISDNCAAASGDARGGAINSLQITIGSKSMKNLYVMGNAARLSAERRDIR